MPSQWNTKISGKKYLSLKTVELLTLWAMEGTSATFCFSLSLSQDKSKTPKYFHISLSSFLSAKGISSKAGFFDKNVNLSDIKQCELEQYFIIFNLTRLFETFIYVMVHILIQKFVSPQYLCTLLVAKNILNII